ncbi:hypothetical protein WJX79_008168 [Trebouxia sp. C0005]
MFLSELPREPISECYKGDTANSADRCKTQISVRQVSASRSLLLRAAREVWASSSYDDRLRIAVFQACLNHGLARGSDHPLRLLPVALSTVEGEVARAGLLRNQSLLTVLTKHTQCFRVMDKGNAGGPAVVPWLHDILIFPHPDVNELLKTMPSLSQPAPPPGIPAGIPPMRKADATGAQVPCKHFALGNCTRGDKCEYAHETDQPGKAHIAGRNVARKRSGPRETPPVDEARKVLLDALMDAWPNEEYIDIFARTAAKICIQQAFVLGKTVPYEQTIVHAPNMGTHLHKCGIGMVRGTLQQMLARPEIQPYFKLTVWPKNTPPNILCLLANVFSGHPSDLVNDIVEQTYLVEPGVNEPYVLPSSIPPRSSFSTRPVLDQSPDSDSISEASSTSHTTVPAEVVASPSRDTVEEPVLSVQEAQMQMVLAVAQGPACEGQGNQAVVRRAINYACLSKGFQAAKPEDATPHHGPYLYKLHSVPVSIVSEHARRIMDNYGYTGQQMSMVLQSDEYRPYFVFGSSLGMAHVRPILANLIPKPSPLVTKILQETKVVGTPITSVSTSTPVPIPRAAIQESPQTHTKAQVKLIAGIEDAKAALRHILQCKWIAVGCEGQDVSKEGRLCLLQVYAAPVCFIFDLVAINSHTRETVSSGLREVLESNSIIKVMHDCEKPAAAVFYQLGIRLCNVFDTQIARGVLQHLAAVTGGELDGFESEIDLEDLLETYGLSLPDCREFIRLNPKHWVKRPLNHNIIEYAVAGVDPLWDLGVRMMRQAGAAGVAGAIRLSRHALQRNYDRADQVAPAQNTRNQAVWAIGKYWQPEISESSLRDVPDNSSELEGHSKKQESFKESLVGGQRNSAQSKAVGASEARGVSTYKAAQAANGNNV